MLRFVRRRNSTDATCHERVYHWQAECWDVPFAHLHDVTTIQQALDCQNMHTVSGNWTRPSPPVACLFSRQVSHRARLGSSGSSGTTTCRESRQCPWTPHCPSRRVGQYSTLAIIDNLVWSMRRRCTALRDATGGHTRYWVVNFDIFPPYVLMALFVIVHWIFVCNLFNSVT